MKATPVLEVNKKCTRRKGTVQLFPGRQVRLEVHGLQERLLSHATLRSHSALYSTHLDGSVGKCFWQMVINLFSP